MSIVHDVLRDILCDTTAPIDADRLYQARRALQQRFLCGGVLED